MRSKAGKMTAEFLIYKLIEEAKSRAVLRSGLKSRNCQRHRQQSGECLSGVIAAFFVEADRSAYPNWFSYQTFVLYLVLLYTPPSAPQLQLRR